MDTSMSPKSYLEFVLDTSSSPSTFLSLSVLQCTCKPESIGEISFLTYRHMSATGANYTTLQIDGFLIWVSPSVAFANPFTLTVVSHHFKTISPPHKPYNLSPSLSVHLLFWQENYGHFVETTCASLQFLQHQTATSITILSFLQS